MAKYKLLGNDTVSGQLKHPESTVLNVVDYGAFNDGTNATATTAAIQAAIDDCVTATGQVVYLPAGTYLINSTLNLTGGMTLRGDGMEKTIIYSTSNSIILNLISGSGNYDFVGPTLKDLQVKGSKTAGSNQIGIKCEPGGDSMAEVLLENIKILTCGSHGLTIKKTFSSKFVHIFSGDNAGYPFVFDVANMPGNHYESLYAGDINSSYPAGYRILSGNVKLRNCNGVNNAGSNSYWAIVGLLTSGGFDSAGSNVTASLTLDSCNLESSKAGGVLSYYGSIISPDGDTTFVGDGASFGVYKPIHYVGIDSGTLPQIAPKATLGDRVTFANSFSDLNLAGTVAVNGTVNIVGTGTDFVTNLIVGGLVRVTISGTTYYRKVATITDATHLALTESIPVTASGQTLQRIYYAEGLAVHANDIPPLITSGEGAKIVQGFRQTSYYNTTNSKAESLYRGDGRFPSVSVTTTTSFSNPGAKYFDVNMASSGTLTLPWPGWDEAPEFLYIRNNSADGVVVTIAATSGGTVAGSTYKIVKKGQIVQLYQNREALDFEVTNLTNLDRIDVKSYGAKGDNSTNDTTAVGNALAAAYTLSKPLYFPSGTYKIDTLIVPTNSLIIYGDGEGKTILKSNDSTKSVIDIDTTSVVIHSITIENLSIECAGTGSSNHGIHIHGTNEPSNLTFRNIRITNCTGSAIKGANRSFTQLYEGIDVSMLSGGGHALDILGSNDCTFLRCYVHTVGTSKAAYRIHSGAPVFIGCNGIDSGTTCFWGLFGDKTADDGADRYVRALFLGSNIEDFTDTGLKFKTGSCASFFGTTITAPSSGTVKALEFEFVDSNTAGIFDATSGINGSSWTNGEPIHSSGMPFMQLGHRDFTTYRDTNVGASTSFPAMVGTLLAGTSEYALTFDGVVRAKDRLIFNEVASIATPPADCVALAAKDVSGVTGLFLKNDAGTEIQLGTGSGTGITWSEITGTTQSMAVNNAYIANNASQVVFTLPNTAAVGSVVEVVGKGAGGWRIGQNASEIIHNSDFDTTTGTGGYIESTHRRDSVRLVCVVANTEWNVVSMTGTGLTTI